MIWSLVELMLREKVRYARFEMRLPMVRRADGLKRDDCCVGSLTSGVSWNVSTPNVCSTTSPICPEMGLTSMRATRACTSCCSVRSGRDKRAEIRVLPCRDIAEQQRRHVDLRQRRIRAEHRPQALPSCPTRSA